MKTTQILRQTALISALLAVPLANNTFGAAVPVDPKTTITATMDGGTAKTGNTWYEVGVNTAALTTGIKTGVIAGSGPSSDSLSTYLIGPANGLNALVLDTAKKTGTLTFGRALSVTALSFAGASGNGAGTITPTLHFSDSTTDTLAPLTVGDWFNVNPRVQTVSGRIDAGANSFNNVNADNPRVLAINDTLSAADAAKFITSIDLSWTGGASTHTAMFGVSGDFTGLGHFSAIPLAAGSLNQDIIVGASEVVVPEPSTIALFGLGAVGLLVCYRRKRS